jgi:anti-sigma factor RsiW
VAASDRDQLQAWLNKRIGVSFKVPDLTDQGYTLLGGRLLASGDKPAAQLMYEDAEKKRITIYLAANPAKADAALRVEEKGPLVACYWLDGPLGFVVAGEMDKEPMMRLARVIYEKFEA